MKKLLDDVFQCPECKEETLFLTNELVTPRGVVHHTYECENPDCEHSYIISL